MLSYVAIMGAIILMFSIPLILKFRDYFYIRYKLKYDWREDYIFSFGILFVLLLHSMLTGSEFTACLTTGPFAYINFRIYKHFWKRY
jgi:hypothetical protein